MSANRNAYLAYGYAMREEPGEWMAKQLSDNYDQLDIDLAAKGWHLVNYCTESHPMYILAIATSIIEACSGWPTLLRVDDLVAPRDEEVQALTAYVKEHHVKIFGGCGWWLASYGKE